MAFYRYIMNIFSIEKVLNWILQFLLTFLKRDCIYYIMEQ